MGRVCLLETNAVFKNKIDYIYKPKKKTGYVTIYTT